MSQLKLWEVKAEGALWLIKLHAIKHKGGMEGWHQMEVNVQRNSSVASLSEKETVDRSWTEGKLAREQISTWWREKLSLSLPGIETPIVNFYGD
jgi:hypothetical protein